MTSVRIRCVVCGEATVPAPACTVDLDTHAVMAACPSCRSACTHQDLPVGACVEVLRGGGRRVGVMSAREVRMTCGALRTSTPVQFGRELAAIAQVVDR